MNRFEKVRRTSGWKCSEGEHEWVQEGGRACPLEKEEGCSQPVFRCSGCDKYDYGEKGGPGYEACKECYEQAEKCDPEEPNEVAERFLKMTEPLLDVFVPDEEENGREENQAPGE